MSVAIVCMVRDVGPPAVNVTEAPDTTSSYDDTSTPSVDVVVGGHDSSAGAVRNPCGGELHHANKTTEGEFDWDRETQSYVLGSFFYGYIVTQLPGGWLSDRYGPKLVITTGMALTTVATLLVPVCARIHVGLVIMLRVIMGLGMGVGFPSLHSLFSKWAPPMERTRLIATTHAGKVVGDIVAFFGSGLLCQYGFDGGWPSVFYLFGIGTAIWLVFWIFFVYDSPAKHPRITAEEREYIESSIGRHVGKAETHSVPWKAIFTSLPMLAMIVAHTCDNWGRYTMMTGLPTYMKDVLKFDIEENGLFSALPYVGMFFVAIIGSQAADFARKKGASTTIVRKVMQVLGFMLPGALLSGIGFVGCSERNVAVAIVIAAISINAFTESAYMVNHIDIAPKYAGVLFAITNFFATLPGILAQLAIGHITVNGSQSEWRTVFFICVAFYIVGSVVYCAFGSGMEQSWANEEPEAGEADAVPLQEERNGPTPTAVENGPNAPLKTGEVDV